MINTKFCHLALGTAQFGMPYGIASKTGQPSFSEVARIISLARSHNIDTIDTAIAYGDSEKVLGEAGIQDFQVITKLPEVPGDTNVAFWIRQQVEGSLSRLRIKQLYGLLLHKPQQINTGLGEKIIDSLFDLKKKGFVKKIGVSVYSPEELDDIWAKFTPDIVQLPFNLVDRRFLDSGWLSRLQNYQVELHTRSSFLQGVLLMPYEEVIQKFAGWSELWSKWFTWLGDTQISPVFACLNFVLNFSEIDKVIIGVDHSHHLADTLNALTHNSEISEFPLIANNDINLINPSFWKP